MKNYLFIILLVSLAFNPCESFCQVYLQNNQVAIQQNQQNVNINLPVIEKKVYIERYRTIYVEKPRVARKLNEPIQLLGYLWVYPEDLGNFKSVRLSIIANLNSQNPYGRNNWRIPTPDELAILEANADKVGLGDDIYLATDHCNGVLRLVSTGEATSRDMMPVYSMSVVIYAGTKWAQENYGASNAFEVGYEYNYSDIQNFTAPLGWRLPTISEFRRLGDIKEYDIESRAARGNEGCILYVLPSKDEFGFNNKLFIPFNKWWGGDYWCVDNGRIRRVTISNTFNSIGYSNKQSDTAAIRLVKE